MIILTQNEFLEAEKLRKASLYEKALKKYKELWQQAQEELYLAGYLHCLRKLDKKEKITKILIAYSTIIPKTDWLRNEITWGLYEYDFKPAKMAKNKKQTLVSGNKILHILNGHEFIAINDIILSLVKIYNENNQWSIAKSLIESINAVEIEKKYNHTIEWNEYTRYIYYKIDILANYESIQDAKIIFEKVKSRLPKTPVNLMRYKIGKALLEQKEYENCVNLYDNTSPRTLEFYDLQLLGECLFHQSDYKGAAERLKIACFKNRKKETMVNTYLLLGKAYEKTGNSELAQIHKSLYNSIKEGNKHEIRKYYETCRKTWAIKGSSRKIEKEVSSSKLQLLQKDKIGIITQLKPDRNFCFIKTKKNSFYSYSSDLPLKARNGDKVKFDTVRSFDKKKNRESQRAINIRIVD